LWGARVGYSLILPSFIALETLGVDSAFKLALLVGLFSTVAVIRWWTGGQDHHDLESPPEPLLDKSIAGRAGLFAIVLYVLTYGADPSSQIWYSANFVIPLLLLMGAYAEWVHEGSAAMILIIGGLVLVAIPNAILSYRDPWPNQSQMVRMAEYLNSHPIKGRLGGWNVGIVGYLLDGKVTNLDGLMNDQVYRYMKNNDVAQYIKDAQIKYIVDYPFQIYDEQLAKMCGYGEELRKALKVVYLAEGADGLVHCELYPVQL
jgi:hypothetical protein